MIAFLLAAWLWDRVVVDCLGNPETTSYYYFQATVRLSATAICYDDQGQPFDCTVMVPGSPIRFTGNIPDPGTGTTVVTTYDPIADPAGLLPTPPVGGLTAWPWPSPDNPEPVVAVDLSGRKSTDVCQ